MRMVSRHWPAQGPVVMRAMRSRRRAVRSRARRGAGDGFVLDEDPRLDLPYPDRIGRRGAKRGFSIQNISPLPITWAEHVTAQGHSGADLRRYMSDYPRRAVLGALCEFLPLPDNRVTLASETDRFGMPVADLHYDQCDNDRALVAEAEDVMKRILTAAGASGTMTIQRFAHLVGGARMGATEQDGVVDRDGRSSAVPNLSICDGSILAVPVGFEFVSTVLTAGGRARNACNRWGAFDQEETPTSVRLVSVVVNLLSRPAVRPTVMYQDIGDSSASGHR